MASIYKRQYKQGVSYTLSWTEGTKRKSKTLGFISQKEAQIKKAEQELKSMRGITSINVPLFKDYAVDYLQWYAVQYASSYPRICNLVELHLIPFFGHLPIDEISLRLVEQYQAVRMSTEKYPNKPGSTATIKSPTVNKELITLKAMLNKAIKWKILTTNPMSDVAKMQELDSKPPIEFSAAQMKRIYASAKYPHYWQLFANTGMRRSEGMNLRWENVGEKTINIESTSQRRTKSGKWREVPITDACREALETFRAEEVRQEQQYLDRIKQAEKAIEKCRERDELAAFQGKSLERPDVCGRKNRNSMEYFVKMYDLAVDNHKAFMQSLTHVIPKMDPHSLSRLAVEDIRRAGIKEGSLHSFRHTFCSHHVEANTNMRVIQLLAGHSDIKTTEKYSRMSPEFLERLNVNI
jgi:integrase